MKFVFTDKKVTLPNSIHAYAEKKVGKLDRFFKEDATATITFSVEKERLNRVEVTIRSSGTIFRVSESTSDMHASIDAAVTTLERQIRKNKTRLEKRLRQGAFERALDVEDFSSFAPDEPEERPTPAEVTPAEAELVKAAEPAVREEAPSPAAPVAEGEKAERIDAFLTGLLAQMGAEARPVIRVDENGTYQVELVGRELGGLIGRRGETLDAIQQLTSYAVNHGQSKRVRIHVDAEGYRAKREESLVRLAQKVAGKVVKYRRNVTLEPMNAYERHVIHTALQETPDITTYSIGTEPNRRTVVAYSRGEHR